MCLLPGSCLRSHRTYFCVLEVSVMAFRKRRREREIQEIGDPHARKQQATRDARARSFVLVSFLSGKTMLLLLLCALGWRFFLLMSR